MHIAENKGISLKLEKNAVEMGQIDVGVKYYARYKTHDKGK